MKIGLFFGSFNPIHIGHLIIANQMLGLTQLEKIWMVISPQSPFKKKASLASNYDRYHLVDIATADHPDIAPSNIEFNLPTPSYTIDTLTYLKEKHEEKDHKYALIMGSDNLKHLHKWKNYERILELHDVYVYLRDDLDKHGYEDHPKVHFVESPLMHISATYIRKSLKEGRSVQYLVPDEVFEYLRTSSLYR